MAFRWSTPSTPDQTVVWLVKNSACNRLATFRFTWPRPRILAYSFHRKLSQFDFLLATHFPPIAPSLGLDLTLVWVRYCKGSGTSVECKQ